MDPQCHDEKLPILADGSAAGAAQVAPVELALVSGDEARVAPEHATAAGVVALNPKVRATSDSCVQRGMCCP